MDEESRAHLVAKLSSFLPSLHSQEFNLYEEIGALDQLRQDHPELTFGILDRIGALTYLSGDRRGHLIEELIELAKTGYVHCEEPQCTTNFILDCIRAALAEDRG